MHDQETWHRVWLQRIEPVQVVSHTAKQVTFLSGGRPRKANKVSSWGAFFPTWEGAHVYLLEEVESELRAARMRLNILQGRVGNIKGMKKPERTA